MRIPYVSSPHSLDGTPKQGRLRPLRSLRTRLVALVPAARRQQLKRAWQRTLFWLYGRLPIQHDVILYQGTGSTDFDDSPRAVFEYLINDRERRQYRHVWVTWGNPFNATTLPDWPPGARVKYVSFKRNAYLRALATSQYLVNNSAFPEFFTKRRGQVYVKTTHGAPFKHEGYDLSEVPYGILRDYSFADFAVSSSPFMTTTLYRHAYRIGRDSTMRVLEIGLPRVDRQLSHDPEQARRVLRRQGLPLGEKGVLLYAPTWRPGGPDDAFFARSFETAEALMEHVLPLGLDVVVKFHPSAQARLANRPVLRPLTVSPAVEANILLAATEVMVTDYSSIVFDFLNSGKPILFHVPDLAEFEASRGFYLPPITWPGPLSASNEELLANLAAVLSRPEAWAEPRAAWRSQHAPHDDGQASRRLVDAVFPSDPSPR